MHLVYAVLHFFTSFLTHRPDFGNTAKSDEHEYVRRLRQYRQESWTLVRQHRTLWVCFIAGIGGVLLTAVLALRSVIPTSVVTIPALLAAWSFRSLTETTKRHTHSRSLVRFYEDGLARLQNRWQGTGTSGEEYRPKNHPYAADLDLFGEGSLFELLCSARTECGSSHLADWLRSPAEPTEIRRRQVAIAEVRGNLALQEAWASAGGVAESRVKSSSLAKWAAAGPIDFARHLKILAAVLPLMVLLTAAASVATHTPVLRGLVPMAVLCLAEAVVATALLSRSRAVSADAVLPVFELYRLMPFFKIIDRAVFKSELLRGLQLPFRSGEVSPRAITQLRLLATLNNLRNSEYFAAVFSILLGGTNCAILIERWRQKYGNGACSRLCSLAEFDAILCLARYSYENPDHVFPIIHSSGSARFEAESLGHATLSKEVCVRYDVRLEPDSCHLLVVTGSNMSGKSTLLRSVGTNAVLALAGAPVRAARMELSRLRVGCSVCVQDSLLDGKSRFATETDRLRHILATASHEPMLFLLDEFLGGTNSDDRLLGAETVIKALVRSGAIGILTTHDARLAELIGGTVAGSRNVHFREHFREGQLYFDYQIHDGIRTRSDSNPLLVALGLVT